MISTLALASTSPTLISLKVCLIELLDPSLTARPAITNSLLASDIAGTKSPPILLKPRTRSSSRYEVMRPLRVSTFKTIRSEPGESESMRTTFSDEALTVTGRL